MRRAIIAAGLTVALFGAAAASASAVVTVTPTTSFDFGRQPLETRSAPHTFIITKQSNVSSEGIQTGEFDVGSGRGSLDSWYVRSDCPELLTTAAPSCSFTIWFVPTLARIGTFTGSLSTHETSVQPDLTVTGFATKPCKKKNFFGHGRITSKSYKKTCKGFPRAERETKTHLLYPGQFG